MFTGLVEAAVPLAAVLSQPPARRLVLDWPAAAAAAAVGESIALAGCCLTVVAASGGRLEFEAGPETLRRTTLGSLKAGDRVNVERSLRLGDRLGGHLVTGHVDGLGTLLRRQDEGDWSRFWFGVPDPLAGQIAAQGSIAVDGVSLTVVEVSAGGFEVALIPHTLAVTTLGRLAAGDRVNLETDLLAKYVQRQLQAGRPAGFSPPPGAAV